MKRLYPTYAAELRIREITDDRERWKEIRENAEVIARRKGRKHIWKEDVDAAAIMVDPVFLEGHEV